MEKRQILRSSSFCFLVARSKRLSMQAAMSVCSAEVSEDRKGQKRVENKRTQRFARRPGQSGKTFLPPKNSRTTVSCSGFRLS